VLTKYPDRLGDNAAKAAKLRQAILAGQ